MRVHRVHVSELAEGAVTLTGPEALHLARVLRVRPGQTVTAFDGSGLEANGEVTGVDDVRVELLLQAPRVAPVEATVKIRICVALLKGDKLSDVVRQCTELGVHSFQPFISRYCDVRELPERKLDRLRRVATEAAKQSGRALVPEVAPALLLRDLTADLQGQRALFADPRASLSLADAVAELPDALSVLSGPEGGFSVEEQEGLAAAGLTGVRLGARILRAETAPLALAAGLLVPEAL